MSTPTTKDKPAAPRLLVVSNRLPITCLRTSAGKWQFTKSSGGLVAALSGVKEKYSAFVWIGWVGCEVPKEEQAEFAKQLWTEELCVPVFLDDKLADEHYNGFSNGILWPLFHYIADQGAFDSRMWHSYLVANQEFAKVTAAVTQPGDMIWVHDYHLMLAPLYLRERLPAASLGFFLHIPFPSSEVYKKLPVRCDVLMSLLQCDLVGFHTYDYARHFIQSCSYLLDNIETTPTGIYRAYMHTVVGAFPVGIEPEKFSKALTSAEVQLRINELTVSFGDRKVLLGVDRLDYIKGIPHKLRAFKLFLKQHPEWRDKITLIQIAVPTRLDVPEYQNLKAEVEGLVGRINGEFGSIGFNPIHYLFKSVNFQELCALYRISDVCLVTSIRDGMNLVCQEYIACQENKHGVLVLSEFAGAASSPISGVRVNPWNVQEVADSIHAALTMDKGKRSQLYETGHHYISTYTSYAWGKRFIEDLIKHSKKSEDLKQFHELRTDEFLDPYMAAKSRLIVLNYDGSPQENRRDSIKSPAKPDKELLVNLARLCQDQRNSVFIHSGQPTRLLDSWFGQIHGIGLIAEHGFFLKMPRTDTWIPTEHLDVSWIPNVQPVLEFYALRTPGAEIEQKQVHLTWNYRRCRNEFGQLQARELVNTLSAIHDVPVEVVHDVEQKAVDIHPYLASTPLMTKLTELAPEFVVHIGNISTAEKIRNFFSPKLQDNHIFTILVGAEYKGRLPSTPTGGVAGQVRPNIASVVNRTLDAVRIISVLAEAS